jgi:hypothetical protein
MMLALTMVATLAVRPVLIVNAGDDAIFSLKVGHAASSSWGDDVLGFSGVIEVSRGRVIRVSFDAAQCVYDLQATYRNGSVVVKHDVDLCKADRIDFED